jgi:hypothetical protein
MSDESSINSADRERSEDEASDDGSSDEEGKREKSDKKVARIQPGKKLQAKWDDMFERLIAYKNEHGDCLVPNRYAKDPQLGSWGKSGSATPTLRYVFSPFNLQSPHNAGITRF